MVLKSVFPALLGAALLAWSGLAAADEYRPDQFLGLDLRSVLLSPKPLGPASRFVPGPLDVTVDRGSAGAQASVEPKTEPQEPQAESGVPQAEPRVRHAESRVRQAESRSVVHKTRIAHARLEKPLRANNRAAPPARNWRGGMAIRSTHRPSIRGFRCGRAGLAASATGSGKAIERRGACTSLESPTV